MVRNLSANAGYAGDVSLIPGLRRSPGGGNSNPLQYSRLGNLVDQGPWRATVHWVAKSQAQLSDWAHTLLLVPTQASYMYNLNQGCSFPQQLPEHLVPNVRWALDVFEPALWPGSTHYFISLGFLPSSFLPNRDLELDAVLKVTLTPNCSSSTCECHILIASSTTLSIPPPQRQLSAQPRVWGDESSLRRHKSFLPSSCLSHLRREWLLAFNDLLTCRRYPRLLSGSKFSRRICKFRKLLYSWSH